MSMKAVLCVSILFLAVLICGCTTTNQVSTGAAAETPSLIGNWTGTMIGYDSEGGYNDYSGYTMTLSITEQNDRIFSGVVIITNQSGAPVWGTNPDGTTVCAGAIGHDGKTLTLVEHGGGHSSGSLIAPDEMEFIYTEESEPFFVVINSLKKS